MSAAATSTQPKPKRAKFADLLHGKGGSGGRCKPIPKQFTRLRFNYCQIAREGNWAIYEQTWLGTTEPNRCYEVIRIKRRKNPFEGGALYEAYPTSERWGTDAFTLTDKDAAFSKLREVAGQS